VNFTRTQIKGMSEMGGLYTRRVARALLDLLNVTPRNGFHPHGEHALICWQCKVINVEGSQWKEHAEGCAMADALPAPEPKKIEKALSDDGEAQLREMMGEGG
jgi:hypothetical protein